MRRSRRRRRAAEERRTRRTPGRTRHLLTGERPIAPAPPITVPTVVVPPLVPMAGRVLEKGTRQPIVGAAVVVDAAVVGETDPDGHFQLTLPAGPHELAVVIAGQEVVRRQIDLVPGVPADEQIFRVLTAGSGAALRHQGSGRSPGDPEGRGLRRRGAPAARLVGRSAAGARLAARRGADRLAGGALRRARRQPGQHRLLFGRHPCPRAVSPGAGAVGHSSLSDRRRRFLSGRRAGQLWTVRLGDHGRPHGRSAGRSRPCRRPT